jgi:small subunit ribosomal protein S2
LLRKFARPGTHSEVPRAGRSGKELGGGHNRKEELAMPVATRRELLEAGVHFGHQTRRWNPKMRRYIFGERSGIYIIDLEKTLSGLQRSYEFLMTIGRKGGVVLFVGTKKQAQETILEHAGRVNMPHVTTRWLGGMLTNFQTMHTRLKRLKELREMERSGAFEFLPKKEVLRLRHEKEKLDRNLSGLQDMERLPDAIFVIDTKREHIAVKEARKLGIPVIAIVDTNCDPDEVDYVIPGNDDAIRACALITKVTADAIQEGQYLAYQGMAGRTFEPEFEKEPAVAASAPEEERRAVQLSKEEQAYLGTLEAEPAVAGADGAAEGSSEGAAEGAEGGTQEAAADTSATWAAPAAPAEMEAETHPDPTGAEAAEGEMLEAEIDSIVEPDGEPAGSDDDQAAGPEGEQVAPAEDSGRPDRAGRGG